MNDKPEFDVKVPWYRGRLFWGGAITILGISAVSYYILGRSTIALMDTLMMLGALLPALFVPALKGKYMLSAIVYFTLQSILLFMAFRTQRVSFKYLIPSLLLLLFGIFTGVGILSL